MKKTFFLLGILLTGFLSIAQQETEYEADAFSRHVALTDAYTRNLDSKSFVKEIKLVNFSGLALLPEGFGIKDDSFADNGKGYDLKAGDGIYTSLDRYEITKSQAGHPAGARVQVLKNIIADQSFAHDDKLAKGAYTGKFVIKCHFYKCGCPCATFTCNVCIWWGWSCIAMDECHIEWSSN